MSAPSLYLGSASGGAVLYRMGEGRVDGSVPVSGVARPRSLAPAGIGGECMFTNLYVSITHAAGGVVRVTAVVDHEEAEESTDIVLEATGSRSQTTVREIALSYPYRVGGVERSRHAPRGTWISAKVETVGPVTDGELEIDGIEVEYEVVREGRKAEP